MRLLLYFLFLNAGKKVKSFPFSPDSSGNLFVETGLKPVSTKRLQRIAGTMFPKNATRAITGEANHSAPKIN